MVVLSKLHWFRTNHHVDTEKDGIARSLSDALDRALRAMPMEDPSITESDVNKAFTHISALGIHPLGMWRDVHAEPETDIWVLSLGETP